MNLGPRRASRAADSKLLTSALRYVSHPRPTNKLRLETHAGKTRDDASFPNTGPNPLDLTPHPTKTSSQETL